MNKEDRKLKSYRIQSEDVKKRKVRGKERMKCEQKVKKRLII